MIVETCVSASTQCTSCSLLNSNCATDFAFRPGFSWQKWHLHRCKIAKPPAPAVRWLFARGKIGPSEFLLQQRVSVKLPSVSLEYSLFTSLLWVNMLYSVLSFKIQHKPANLWWQSTCYSSLRCGSDWWALLLTSLIKYLGFQGFLVAALCLPSLRCRSSRQCLCSVAASMFPAFSDTVTCCQRRLDKKTQKNNLHYYTLSKLYALRIM